MTREQIIDEVLRKYRIDMDAGWIKHIITAPIDKIKHLSGYQIDFTGKQHYFAAMVEARERIAREIKE